VQVLEANPAHVKGLYRRGMAYMGNGDFEEARADFKMVNLHTQLCLEHKVQYYLFLKSIVCYFR
jgi:hypothetical protein